MIDHPMNSSHTPGGWNWRVEIFARCVARPIRGRLDRSIGELKKMGEIWSRTWGTAGITTTRRRGNLDSHLPPDPTGDSTIGPRLRVWPLCPRDERRARMVSCLTVPEMVIRHRARMTRSQCSSVTGWATIALTSRTSSMRPSQGLECGSPNSVTSCAAKVEATQDRRADRKRRESVEPPCPLRG
jgi:hypothetical protein